MSELVLTRGISPFDGEKHLVGKRQQQQRHKAASQRRRVARHFPDWIESPRHRFRRREHLVALVFDNAVIKLRASDGTRELTVPVGAAPRDVIFDALTFGSQISTTRACTKYRPTVWSPENFLPDVTRRSRIRWARIWVTNYTGATVTALRASSGKQQGVAQVGVEPEGIAFDGSHIWVANSADDTVTRLRAKDGSQSGTFQVDEDPRGILFDGTSIWVACFGSNTVDKITSTAQ